jgi:acyl carrier protein
MTSILDRLQSVARAVFGDDTLVLEGTTTAHDVVGWDSLGHVNFMYSVEEEFGVEFTEDEFTGFDNVAGLEAILEHKLRAAR